MASRKRKDRKKKRPIGRPHRPATPQQAMADLTRKHGGLEHILVDSPDMEKMSEVLIEFLDPYLDPFRSLKELTNLVNMGVAAWNVALLPEPNREQALREAMALIPPDGQVILRALLDSLVRRKLTLFADIRRGILDVQVTRQPDGSPHLSVVSTLPLPTLDPNVPPEQPPSP